MAPQPKLKGFTLRLLYAQFSLLAKLGLGVDPDKTVAQPMSVRKNKAPAWMTLPLPPDVRLELDSFNGRAGPIAIKKYLPPKIDPSMPRLMFLHGGGWIGGGLDTLDHLCASVAAQASCLVVSVEYRLAPETPFPGALEDCDDALSWTLRDSSLGPLPAAGLVVMGESAGGNLAAALCVLRARQGNSPIRHQILIYPALDFTMASESMHTIRQPGLEKKNVLRLIEMYCGQADLKDPLVSPMFADNASALPPAYIITADVDPLRDDGARYARKLADAGVPVRYDNYPGMPHGFFFTPGICSSAVPAIAEIVKELRKLAKG
ncbi:MAG TPA: alpha/beta hydrolase [Nevskiaceae bacterium]|nr:alpha/beta hydrolase [Nevskiaceae bacterium]